MAYTTQTQTVFFQWEHDDTPTMFAAPYFQTNPCKIYSVYIYIHSTLQRWKSSMIYCRHIAIQQLEFMVNSVASSSVQQFDISVY